MGDNTEPVVDTEAEKIIANEEEASRSASATDSTSDDEEEEHLYGWRCYTPSWLQCLNTPLMFLIVMCFAILGQSMMVNGLIAVSMSSLETRFELSSSQVSVIPSTYELAGVPFLLIVGYYGAVVHKPRWISVGMFVLSISSLLYALPHFTTGLYEWSGNVDDNLCHPGSNRSVSILLIFIAKLLFSARYVHPSLSASQGFCSSSL